MGDADQGPLAGLWDRGYQVGVVVRDLDRAVAFYEALGVGPFTEGPSAHTLERRIYGEQVDDAQVKGLIAQMGNIEFELLQPVTDNTIQAEFLEKHGEGVVHICGFTDDLDRDMAKMEEAGYPVISYGLLDDGGKFAYFDTREVGGLVLELFETGDNWK